MRITDFYSTPETLFEDQKQLIECAKKAIEFAYGYR
jgi:TfoX/Sxy family transcriptional regulator of competence genes